MLFIVFHYAMFIWVHLDAQISGARVLYAITCCYLSEHEDLLFLLLLMCTSYGHELYMCFDVCHSIFTRLRDVSDFSVLVISPSLFLLLFCCHVSMCLQRDPCSFWWCSVRMFCRYCCNWSIHALVCNYGVPQHDSIFLYFCYKIFLADCLRVIQFAKLVVVDTFMLCICSCHV